MNIYVAISILILIVFLVCIRVVILKIIKKRRQSKCKSRPVTYKKPANDCPNLDDYVHRSELVPNHTFRINPYYVKQIEKEKCKSPREKPNMYEYDWIPVLDSECIVE